MLPRTWRKGDTFWWKCKLVQSLWKTVLAWDFLKKLKIGISSCGATGSVASLQCQDTGSIPCPGWWVTGSSLAAPWVATAAWIPSLAQELHVPWGVQKRKKKNRTTTWSSTPTSGIYLKEWNQNLKRYLHAHVSCSIFLNSQDMEINVHGLMNG